MDKLNLGVIGLGSRGYSVLVWLLLGMEDVNVTVVCDVYEDRARAGQRAVFEKTGKEPLMCLDYHDAIKAPGLDAVLIFTSWDTHAEIAIASMKAGIPVGSEVGCEYSLSNCQRLVDTYEETGTPYMFMENCCYGKEELLATSMARRGLFGEIVHCAGAYAHDLRYEVAWGIENRHYRFRNYEHRCCENYPTHELGPIARLLDINRGNRIVSVVSLASKAAGLKAYIEKEAETKNVPEYMKKTSFMQGDIVTTILKCANGETIQLRLDTTLPRFYSRNFTVRGTKGLYEQDTNMVFLDGVHEDKYFDTVMSYEQFMNNAREYEKDYLPPIWKSVTPEVEAAGHGGMDYFVYRAFIEAVKNKTPMPIDVYDGVTWMAVGVLSEMSIRNNGAVQDMPDFTHGKWQTRPREDVVEM